MEVALKCYDSAVVGVANVDLVGSYIDTLGVIKLIRDKVFVFELTDYSLESEVSVKDNDSVVIGVGNIYIAVLIDLKVIGVFQFNSAELFLTYNACKGANAPSLARFSSAFFKPSSTLTTRTSAFCAIGSGSPATSAYPSPCKLSTSASLK